MAKQGKKKKNSKRSHHSNTSFAATFFAMSHSNAKANSEAKAKRKMLLGAVRGQ